MKTIIFIRHGKSDWGADYSQDHDRPLAKRGQKDARRMGKFLTLAGMVPDSIVTSSAVRAYTTVELAAKAGKWKCPIRVSSSLYGASPKTVLAEISHESDASQTLLVAGHEPTWAHTCSLLIGGGNLRYPTTALACIALPVKRWSKIAPGQGQLLWLLPPRLLRSAGFDD